MPRIAWALQLLREDAHAMRGLRLQPGLEVCEQGSRVWLRGPTSSSEVVRSLLCLPALARFRCDAGGALIPEGARLPVGSLPDGPWGSLRSYLPLDPQPAQTAPEIRERVPLSLVRAKEEREATLLSTTFEAWRAWASSAPAARLASLSFAVSGDGRALIRGLPLPPLPGRRLYEQHGVAAPCGLTWSPAVDSRVVSELFDLLPGELVLLGEATCDVISGSAFVVASRSAVRATAEERAGG